MSELAAKKDKVKKYAYWIDRRTSTTMKDICEAVIAACYGADGPLLWQRLQEVILERRFGRERAYFETSQMTVPDCWRASARLMQRELDKWHKLSPKPDLAVPEAMPDENQFAASAMRSLTAGIKLAAMCSSHSTQDLEFHYKTKRVNIDQDDWEMLRKMEEEEDEDAPEGDADHQDEGASGKNCGKPVELDGLVTQIRASNAFKQKYDPPAEGEEAIKPKDPDTSDDQASVLEGQSREYAADARPEDIDLVLKIAQSGDTGKGLRSEHIPTEDKRTAGGALRGHVCFETAKADLWRLLAWLRMGPDGCDCDFIRNHYASHAS